MPQKQRFIFEKLDHYWEITPYIFRPRHSPAKDWRAPHVHEELTFLFVINGNIELSLEEKNFIIGAGDLVSINPFYSHAQKILTESDYVRIIISSSFLLYNGLDPTSLLFDELIHDNKVLVMMTEMINEFNNPNPYQKTIMNSFILTFISYLIKNYSQQAENSKKELFHVRQKEYKYIEEALNYIRLHFSETITLDDLCATSGLSRSYLTKLFKRYTGYSPLDYINNIRCGYAKQMILNGSTVTQAAFSSGFNSTSYFTLCFKKHKGCLPSEIVKQNELIKF